MNEEIRNLINALSVDNFRLLVKELNKEKYSTNQVRIIDGPYDGGNDLEILIENQEIRKNIQITVQKHKWENKLEKDLLKAKENVQKFSYLTKLEFYSSQNISKEKRNRLETAAEVNHGLDLKIIDATILSNDSETYKSIAQITYKAHGIKANSLNGNLSKESKILFDVLSGNKNTVEIRKNLIYSYIYSYLFNNPNSRFESIIEEVNNYLQNNIDEDYLLKEINYLKSKGHIVTPNSKEQYQLSVKKQSEIENIHKKIQIQEHKLVVEIEKFILNHSINCEVSELVEAIHKIYIENYQIDIDEIKNTSNSFSSSLKKSFNDLQTFLIEKGINRKDAGFVSKEILTKCSEKEYLNKLATTSLFANLYNSHKLEEYLNNRLQTVYVDTQILIRLLCIYFNEDFEYEDSALIAVKSFHKSVSSNSENVHLVTSVDYIQEVSGHLQEALKLQRFLNLSFISEFGASKNVFYNVYNRYKEVGEISDDMDLVDFIQDLLGEEHDVFEEENFINNVTNRLCELYEIAGFEIIWHPNYENYSSIKRDYEISLAYAGKERSYTARENDLRTILYLSSEDLHLNPENGVLNEPFLITWDSAFYNFRKTLLKKYRQLSYWYIYSPLKFIDRLSVMNFKLSSDSITHNIVALAETNFNYSTKTNSFFDVISTFFNKKEVSKLSILKKLANLKRETEDLEGNIENESIFETQETPITNVLLNIRNYYTSFESNKSFEELINVFENEEYESKIYDILKTAVKNYKSEGFMKKTYFKIDELIEKKD
ncbi:hypothetical protein [Flagellimonas lutimaris]|uniref:hypothetical protein n=1 Tax=Flagellimonas lutimaris TaxID=475082 RepID=UPI003F5CEA20